MTMLQTADVHQIINMPFTVFDETSIYFREPDELKLGSKFEMQTISAMLGLKANFLVEEIHPVGKIGKICAWEVKPVKVTDPLIITAPMNIDLYDYYYIWREIAIFHRKAENLKLDMMEAIYKAVLSARGELTPHEVGYMVRCGIIFLNSQMVSADKDIR